ncbi:MAG: ribonuclease HII [Candidatus Pacebacteria bacterium]|nr:ribonuclease HII [Candidatus Paceibacterota bacterium]
MVLVKKHIVIAIDEAGRGPLAGPISVAAVAANQNEKFKARNAKLLKGIKDSKKLSEKQREEWLKKIKKNFEYQAAMVGQKTIDKIGISRATKLAVGRILNRFNKKPDIVLLDGSLFAPKIYNQKTIIKGDEKIPLISAASIIAKVRRDRKMVRLHKEYPQYHFDVHKGYGTKLHYKMLKKYGISPLHRRSFLKKLK